jgi:hypothetical protein
LIPPPVERLHLESDMSRNRKRVPLESGQRLDINALRRDGIMDKDLNGALAVVVKFPQIDFEQKIALTSRPRPYGGRQYYFVCPATQRRCAVLWRPNGAKQFASRQAWRGQVAYASQFADPCDRAWLMKHKVGRKLGGDGSADIPPRPKHMRQGTYDRWYDRWYEQEQRIDDALMRFYRAKWPHLKVFN